MIRSISTSVFSYFGYFRSYITICKHGRKQGKLDIDYGISYGLAFALFAGPYGVFLYQVVYRTSVYLLRKVKKENAQIQCIDTLYNIGAFTLSNMAGYYLFYALIPYFSPVSIWLLVAYPFLNGITMYMSDLTLLTLLYLEKSIQTRQDCMGVPKGSKYT